MSKCNETESPVMNTYIVRHSCNGAVKDGAKSKDGAKWSWINVVVVISLQATT